MTGDIHKTLPALFVANSNVLLHSDTSYVKLMNIVPEVN